MIMPTLSLEHSSVPRSAAPSGRVRTFRRAFLMLAVAFTLANAGAQTAAVLDPANALYEAPAGTTISGRVSVQNPSPAALELQVYLADWLHSQTGDFEFFEAGSLDSSLAEWITYSSESLPLEPNQGAALDYTITVPPDAAPGTYWGILFVESQPGAPAPGQTVTTFSVRVGHVIYVNVPELTLQGAISGMFGEPPLEETDPYRVIGLYSNGGNAMQIVQGALTVRDSAGTVVIEVAIPRRVILPASTRALVVSLFGPLPIGNYTAVLVLDYGDETREVAGAFDFQLQSPLAAPPVATDEQGSPPESDQP